MSDKGKGKPTEKIGEPVTKYRVFLKSPNEPKLKRQKLKYAPLKKPTDNLSSQAISIIKQLFDDNIHIREVNLKGIGRITRKDIENDNPFRFTLEDVVLQERGEHIDGSVLYIDNYENIADEDVDPNLEISAVHYDSDGLIADVEYKDKVEHPKSDYFIKTGDGMTFDSEEDYQSYSNSLKWLNDFTNELTSKARMNIEEFYEGSKSFKEELKKIKSAYKGVGQ